MNSNAMLNQDESGIMRESDARTPQYRVYFRLLACMMGIYVFFLTWGVLQERITTMEYVSYDGTSTGRFRHFAFLNAVQALSCSLIALIVLWIQGSDLGPKSPSILFEYIRLAILASSAAPFGYASLKHISFPIMILGKSCKLLPVMLMNIVVYQKRFPPSKYLTVLLITLGVAGFMLFEPAKASGHPKAAHANVEKIPLLGLSLLLVNLLLDGTINSLQDRIFIQHPVSGQQMMFWMQLFSFFTLASYLLLSPWSNELSQALSFAHKYPRLLPDVFLFGLCGALGQIFVFYTLQHFGSLLLTTLTVTRKLFTIMISLLWFDHNLASIQYLCVLLVFIALVLEAIIGRSSKHKSHGHTAPLSMSIKETDALLTRHLKIPSISSDKTGHGSRIIGKLKM